MEFSDFADRLDRWILQFVASLASSWQQSAWTAWTAGFWAPGNPRKGFKEAEQAATRNHWQ